MIVGVWLNPSGIAMCRLVTLLSDNHGNFTKLGQSVSPVMLIW